MITFPIETERLLIRPLVAADADELYPVWSDPANERFSDDWQAPRSIEETRAFIERDGPWGVWERESGELIGDCGLFRAEGEWELAYGLRRDRWGRGYATEAAWACVEAGFEQLGLERIVADIKAEGSPPSERILAKLGFRPWRHRPDKTIYVLKRSSARRRPPARDV